MKKSVLWIATVALFGSTLFGCGRGGGKMMTDADSLSYVIGLNVGRNLLEMDSTLNVEAVCRAIRDVYDGTERMTMEEARDYFLGQKTYFVHEKAQAYQERLLADLSKRDRSYVRTRSGVTYKISTLGDQSVQTMSARDTVRYICTILGEAGDTIRQRDTLRQVYRDIISGLQEVVKIAGNGGVFDAWLPSKTAFDTAGNDSLGIAPNQLLRCEVEILDIDYYNNNSNSKNKKR